MKNKAAWIMAILFILCFGIASALQVNIEGEVCPLPVTDMAGKNAQVMEVTEFDLIGLLDDEHVFIRIGKTPYLVDAADFEDMLPELDARSVSDGTLMHRISRSAPNSDTHFVQNLLIACHYMNTSDGIYGSYTYKKVAAFQKDHGLKITGSADVATQMLMQAVCAPVVSQTTTYPIYRTVETKFALIMDRTDVNLEPFTDLLWKFSYDAAQETGDMLCTATLGGYSFDRTDMEAIDISANIRMLLSEDEESGIVEFTPVITVTSEGAYRPCFSDIQIDGIVTETYRTEYDFEGAKLVERADFLLSPEMYSRLGREMIVFGDRNYVLDADDSVSAQTYAAAVEQFFK